MGRLSLPVIDAASAATLAKVLGPEGIKAQLAAMGINPMGQSTSSSFSKKTASVSAARPWS